MNGGDPPTSNSRPASPASFMTNSFDNATAQIDDLTAALENFSRVPSPELAHATLTCCCGREECGNFRAWTDLKSKLESRLVLSAEIGQALLQRHEAHIRRSEERYKRESTFSIASIENGQDVFIQRILDEKDQLERKLNQALVNNEVTEVSNRTVLQELQESQATISRLSAHHARSVGWDSKLSAATKERDDMQQERDSESQRARLAESRFAALKDRTTKLQADVRRLQQDLEERRHQQIESSESTIRDAQARLESFQKQHLGQSVATEQEELSKAVESLVQDNAALKRDNAELQQLLEDTRQEFRATQEELDEQRALFTPSPRFHSARLRGHNHTGSMPSNVLKLDSPTSFTFGANRRSNSAERKSRRYLEPLTPDTERPSSPFDTPSSSRYPSSPLSIQIETIDTSDGGVVGSPEEPKPQHRPLLLLSRSKGVQTDLTHYPNLLSPSPQPTPSPQDPRSESSSFSSELSGNTSHMTVLLDRLVSLLSRMNQADALTLTNRLKRQNLAKGADVGHLSRSTVSTIVAEVNALRSNFRPFLEDDKAVLACTRKDLRSLLRLFKDLFAEWGELRITMNDVILDPSIAPRLSELALDPIKAEQERQRLQGGQTGGRSIGGWIAPISKLFGGATGTPPPQSSQPTTPAAAALSRSLSSSGTSTRAPRPVPKLAAAASASTTTVNVEFSGSGPGRSVTSTSSQGNNHSRASRQQSGASQSSVLSIFAGAPGRISPDPWIVLPRNVPSAAPLSRQPSTPSFRRATLRPGANSNRISRHLDAVIDVEGPAHAAIQEDKEAEFDINSPIVPRTLRRRGMSDSSMHSTFASQAAEAEDSNPAYHQAGPSGRQDAWPVFQAIGRRVQSLRTGGTDNDSTSRSPDNTPQKPYPQESLSGSTESTPSKALNRLMSSLQPPIDAVTGGPREHPFMVGSVPTRGYDEDPFLHRGSRMGDF